MSLSTGLIGYWKFDENTGTTANDSTTNNLDWTLSNAASWSSDGKLSASLLFNNNYYASQATNTLFNWNNQEFSFSFWFKTTDNTKNQLIWKRYTGSGSNFFGQYISITTAGKISFWTAKNNVGSLLTTNTILSNNTWYYINCIQKSNGMFIYINGELDNSDSTTYGNQSNTGTAYIGNDGEGFYKIYGQLDELGIWSRALTADEVKRLYDGGTGKSYDTFSNLTTGLVGYWKFDENTGTTAKDSLSTNNLSFVGSNGSWTVGKINSGYYATGVDSYVSKDTSVSGLSTGEFDHSMSAWFYTTDNTVGQMIVNVGDGASKINGTNIGIYWVNTGNIIVYNGSSVDTDYSVSTTINNNTWYHIAITYDKATRVYKIYKDGNNIGTSSSIGRALNTNPTKIRIGYAISNVFPIKGKVDEVGYWERKLTPQEIATLYNGGYGLTYPFTGKRVFFVGGGL